MSDPIFLLKKTEIQAIFGYFDYIRVIRRFFGLRKFLSLRNIFSVARLLFSNALPHFEIFLKRRETLWGCMRDRTDHNRSGKTAQIKVFQNFP